MPKLYDSQGNPLYNSRKTNQLLKTGTGSGHAREKIREEFKTQEDYELYLKERAYQKEYQKTRRARMKAQRHAEKSKQERVTNPGQEGEKFQRSECRSQTALFDFFRGYAEGTDILGKQMTFEEWLDERDKCRKDLFHLGRDILHKDLVPEVHQVVCDQFVQKNFDDMYFDGYTLGDFHQMVGQQLRFDKDANPTKEMMLLDSRGFFKSTIDGVDCVQWLLNCPDVRILIMTGEIKLATQFMSEVKSYFALATGEQPTQFHRLFPEYIIRGLDATTRQPFTTPARQLKQTQPSVAILTVGSNTSGRHCDILKIDDGVTDENSISKEQREKIKDKLDNVLNLVGAWGFTDFIGTRYIKDDYYGTRLEAAQESSAAIKYFCRAAWYRKPGFENEEEYPLRTLSFEMVDLTFPTLNGTPQKSFAHLRSKLLRNERLFRCQQLQQPQDDEDTPKIVFEEPILRAHILPVSAIPTTGPIFAAWDWAHTSHDRSDYSAGAVGRVVFNRETMQNDLYVIDVVFGRFKPSELAFQIALLNKRHMPSRTWVERMVGAELLQLEVSRQAVRLNTDVSGISYHNSKTEPDAKFNRIKDLEILLNNNRLWFQANSLWNDEMMKQFVMYTGEKKNKGRKDDIPDAISILKLCALGEQTAVPLSPEERESRDVANWLNAGIKGMLDRPDKPAAPPMPLAVTEAQERVGSFAYLPGFRTSLTGTNNER